MAAPECRYCKSEDAHLFIMGSLRTPRFMPLSLDPKYFQ